MYLDKTEIIEDAFSESLTIMNTICVEVFMLSTVLTPQDQTEHRHSAAEMHLAMLLSLLTLEIFDKMKFPVPQQKAEKIIVNFISKTWNAKNFLATLRIKKWLRMSKARVDGIKTAYVKEYPDEPFTIRHYREIVEEVFAVGTKDIYNKDWLNRIICIYVQTILNNIKGD